MDNTKKWVIEDHLCRKCGGRILRCVEGGGMTPGGNPVFRCADCGETKSGLMADVLCWCGMKHRYQNFPAYVCLPFSKIKDHPELESEFRKCGCDPSRGEVGIILKDGAKKILRQDRKK